MPRKLIITQRETLRGIRRPLPPATRVTIDHKTKARRKRVKLHPMDLFLQCADWTDRAL